MKQHIRWQLLLAMTGLGLVLSLLSFQAQSANLCTIEAPAAGGALVEGMVGRPERLNPLLADANLVDQQLVNLIFDGLTEYDENGELAPALAQSWQVREDGRTIDFALRDDVRWHDGQPFTAADVAFTYGLLQDTVFAGPPARQAHWQQTNTLWQSVTITVTGDYSITFGLAEPYAPFLEATTRGILPAHRLEGVTAATLDEHSFSLMPVGTGPFMVATSANWRESGRLRLTPNPAYWRQGTQLDSLELRFYPDDEALIAAFRTGEVQALNTVSANALPVAGALPGMRLFTSAASRYTQLLFNLSESGAPALKALQVRQALAYGTDRETLVDETLHGQGLPLEGPYLPTSWAYNPRILTDYSYSPITATALLEEDGWLLPEGLSTRQKDGAPLYLRLLFSSKPSHREIARALVDQWAELGAQIALAEVGPDQFLDSLGARAFDVAVVDVAPPADPDLYDFWSQESILRGQNYAGWNHRRASEALENGRKLWPIAERRPYYDAFARFFDSEAPALTLYQHVVTYGLNESVHNAEVGRVFLPRDRYDSLEEWFLLYRQVTVSCENAAIDS